MAYTAPRTWVAGETVTAAQMNEQVRDNISHVYGRQPYTKQLWVGNIRPTVTAGAGAPAQIEMGTNKNVYDYLPFDGGTVDEYGYANVPMPDDYDGGTVTAQFYWMHPTTTTNFKVSWGMAGVCIADAGDLDVAPGTFQYANDTGGTANVKYMSPETAAITIAGSPAAKNLCQFRFVRHCSDTTNDTLAVDAYLIGATIRYGII